MARYKKMALIKKLTKIGNSWGVILPTDLLKVVGIEDSSEVEISVKENQIVLRPTSLKDRKVMKAFMKVLDQYDKTFEKLAK
jgi:antitoxin component of MazEF toxin-antitoxin module